MADDPTPAEMWRRMDEMRFEQRENFNAINIRLDKMLTNDGLATYMGTHITEMRHLRQDVDDLKKETRDSDARLELRIDRNEQKTVGATRWGITALIAAAGVIVGGLGLYSNLILR